MLHKKKPLKITIKQKHITFMYMLLNTAIPAIFWAIIYVCNPGAIYSHCHKSDFILTFLLEGCLEYQIYQVQYLQSNKAGFGGYKIIKFSTSYGRPIYRETENIQEGYRDRLSKTGLDFENCTQQLFTLTMCLSACLWAQIARTLFNYTITARTLLAKYADYLFQRLILHFPALGKNYRIATMFIITQAASTPRDVEIRESVSMFCETRHFLKFERIE